MQAQIKKLGVKTVTLAKHRMYGMPYEIGSLTEGEPGFEIFRELKAMIAGQETRNHDGAMMQGESHLGRLFGRLTRDH